MRFVSLVLAFAWRDIKGGLRQFKLLILGTAFGVAAVASVVGLADMVSAGARDGARATVGGDISLRLFHVGPNEEQIAFLRRFGIVSHTVEMRPGIGAPGRPAPVLAEVKAIDDHYPLYGALKTISRDAADPFARRGGVPGAVVDLALLERLGVGMGETLSIGGADFEIRGLIEGEPDRTMRAFSLGPRVMIGIDAFRDLHVEGRGFPVYHYLRLRLRLDEGVDADEALRAIEARFPDAPWRIVDARDGVPGLERAIDLTRAILLFLSIGILLVSGSGIGRAVAAHVAAKEATIAILKAVGGANRVVSAIYLVQVAMATTVGVAGGLVAAGIVVTVFFPVLADAVAIQGGQVAPPFGAFGLAVAVGYSCALLFSVPALARLRDMSPQSLLRRAVSELPTGFFRRAVFPAVPIGLLALWVIVFAAIGEPLWAGAFVGLSAVVVILFGLVGRGLAVLSRAAARRTRSPLLRLALADLGRPGAATGPVVLTLGLGLTLITAVVAVQSAAQRHLTDSLPKTVADAFLINIDPADGARLETEVGRASPAVERVRRLPFLHARITALNGRPIDGAAVAASVKWVVRGDRGITWFDPGAGEIPAPTSGDWWPAGYEGPPLASVDRAVADKLGLAIGGTVTLNVSGEVVTARVANLREVDWTRLDLETPIVLNAAALRHVSHGEIMAVWLADDADAAVALTAVEAAAAGVSPLIAALRTAPVLRFLGVLLDRAGGALMIVSGVVVAAALLVLAGSVAAGHRQRTLDATIYKVLGASRRQLIVAGAIEFLILGAVAGGMAVALGGAFGYAIVGRIAAEAWFLPWDRVIALILGGGALTLSVGLWASLRAFTTSSAEVLRGG